LDTGPLVALLDARDHRHAWALTILEPIRDKLLSCEPVITEACFLLQHIPGGSKAVLDFLTRGAIRIGFDLTSEATAVAALMDRYANVPMSLADACLVRMAELYPNSRVLTLDGDFRIYRKNGRDALDSILPEV
jgi:predicted nucleic acid-binding protein